MSSVFSLLSILALLIAQTPCVPLEASHSHQNIAIEKHTAQEVIAKLGLVPNIEKGYYVQTFQDSNTVNNRSASTAIYYLLEGSAGPSYWHRVDAVEIWHHYAGAPLTLSLSNDDGNPVIKHVLGPDIFNGQQPQIIIGKWEWQRATSLGDWTLVGTTGMFSPHRMQRIRASYFAISCTGLY